MTSLASYSKWDKLVTDSEESEEIQENGDEDADDQHDLHAPISAAEIEPHLAQVQRDLKRLEEVNAELGCLVEKRQYKKKSKRSDREWQLLCEADELKQKLKQATEGGTAGLMKRTAEVVLADRCKAANVPVTRTVLDLQELGPPQVIGEELEDTDCEKSSHEVMETIAQSARLMHGACKGNASGAAAAEQLCAALASGTQSSDLSATLTMTDEAEKFMRESKWRLAKAAHENKRQPKKQDFEVEYLTPVEWRTRVLPTLTSKSQRRAFVKFLKHFPSDLLLPAFWPAYMKMKARQSLQESMPELEQVCNLEALKDSVSAGRFDETGFIAAWDKLSKAKQEEYIALVFASTKLSIQAFERTQIRTSIATQKIGEIIDPTVRAIMPFFENVLKHLADHAIVPRMLLQQSDTCSLGGMPAGEITLYIECALAQAYCKAYDRGMPEAMYRVTCDPFPLNPSSGPLSMEWKTWGMFLGAGMLAVHQELIPPRSCVVCGKVEPPGAQILVDCQCGKVAYCAVIVDASKIDKGVKSKCQLQDWTRHEKYHSDGGGDPIFDVKAQQAQRLLDQCREMLRQEQEERRARQAEIDRRLNELLVAKQACKLGRDIAQTGPSKEFVATSAAGAPDMSSDTALFSNANMEGHGMGSKTALTRDNDTEIDDADIHTDAATVVAPPPKLSRKAKQSARCERQRSRQLAWEAAEAKRQRAEVLEEGMKQHALAEARAKLAMELDSEESARAILRESLEDLPLKGKQESLKTKATASKTPVLGLVGGVTVRQTKEEQKFERNAISLASEMSLVDC